MNTQTQEALKMAIEAMEESKVHLGSTKHLDDLIQACKEALEQPAQEPVAWRVLLDESPEDTDWHYMTGEPWECFKQSAEPLYAHPATSWQGLSDDEIKVIDADCWVFPEDESELFNHYKFARAIEQALRSKNEH